MTITIDLLDVIASDIRNAPDLDALAEALRAFWEAIEKARSDDEADPLDVDAENALRVRGVDLADLPTFGGEEPADTRGIWSWDATRLLYGWMKDTVDIGPRPVKEG